MARSVTGLFATRDQVDSVDGALRMKSDLVAAYVSSYPPRACGIATFTRDLSEAVATSGYAVGARIAAINDDAAIYEYPPIVRWTIDQCDPESWIDVARQINKSRAGIISIQHEFGMCGRFERDGRFIDHVRGFLKHVEQPVVATLHTVVPHPRPDLREAIRALHDHSMAVVTMANMARLILEQEYGLNPEKLYTIPHGVPAVQYVDPQTMKHALHLDDHTILCTFGLLSSGKGIQYMIRALPDVVKRHPDVLYLVIGETHPDVRRREGERYRNALIDLVHTLHLEQHVRFINQYLTTPRLMRYLQTADIYITPYVERKQSTSGTLAYALGCGKAVISTPYLYAVEALAEGRGMLAEFQNPKSFARCVNLLLENPGLRTHCEQSAFAYGQAMSWDNVGRHYAALFQTLLGAASVPDTARHIKGGEKTARIGVPEALPRPAAMTIT